MPLMGALYVGNSGLSTSQNALNTTAHNMTNADTTGYVRQQVQQGTRFYNTIRVDPNAISNQQIGLGVNYSKVKQVRDFFLDQTYRRESGRGAFYEVSWGALEEVESLFDELNGETFQAALEGVWEAIQELSKDPSNAVTQGLLVQKSSQFVERAQFVYQGLVDYQMNLNQQIKQKVDIINDYAEQITVLNEEICAIECGGIESANDLRDQRNYILDELAKMGKISYTEDVFHQVHVQFEGVDLVKREQVYEIGLHEDENTGFYTPFWIQNATFKTDKNGERIYNIEGAEVYDLNTVISTELNTDIGSLRSMVLVRGDHHADYTDVLPENYDHSISQSVIMNVQAEFDQLIHNVVTAINKVLEDAAMAEDPATGYLRNEDGSPLQMFTKIATDSYELQADGSWQYVQENQFDKGTLYSVMNLQINKELMQTPAKLGFMKEDKSVDYDTVEKMKAKFMEESNTLNPNVKKKSNFVDYYGDLIAQIANSGSVNKSILANQEVTVNSTFTAREEVIGVSSDDELTYMVKFQNAYNASSRYINVIDEMLEHLINALAV